MNEKRSSHLEEDEILMSVVEKNSLHPDAAEHLSACKMCREARDNLAKRLESFAALTREMIPAPGRPVSLDASTRGQGWSRIWNPRAIGLTAAGLAMAALLIVGIRFHRHAEQPSLAGLTRELLEDERFLAEIEYLEEHALPDALLSVHNGEETEELLEDGFMDFISPGGSGEWLTTKTLTEVTPC